MPEGLIETDICVIGAGSGGLIVAAGASQLGADTVLIERGRMGGDCLNYGCIPSKSLLAAAHVAHSMRRGGLFGIGPTVPEIDFARVSAPCPRGYRRDRAQRLDRAFHGAGRTGDRGERALHGAARGSGRRSPDTRPPFRRRDGVLAARAANSRPQRHAIPYQRDLVRQHHSPRPSRCAGRWPGGGRDGPGPPSPGRPGQPGRDGRPPWSGRSRTGHVRAAAAAGRRSGAV